VSASLAAIEPLLARVVREARWRRAERGAWRGAFWGAIAAIPLFALREGSEAVSAGMWAPSVLVLVLAPVLAGLLVGALLAALRAPGRIEAARIADRALGLQDRLATLLEFPPEFSSDAAASTAASVAGQQFRLRNALAEDVARRIAAPAPRPLLARVLPREARWLPGPVAVLVLLALLPAWTGPANWPGDRLRAWLGGGPARGERAAAAAADTPEAGAREFLRRKSETPAEAVAPERRAAPAAAEAEPQFRDKAIAGTRTDFASFMKQGDDRLRVLERAEKLPDLQSDFASSRHKAMQRRSQELAAGGKPQNISAQKLAELLREMEKLGRRDAALANEIAEGAQALDQGRTAEAWDAVQNAIDRLRELEEKQRGGRNLRGGRDSGEEGRNPAQRSDEAAQSDGRDGAGIGAGNGRGPEGKGKPSARLRSTPYNTVVQGERRNRQPNLETQAQGNSAATPEGAQTLGVLGQYRRMMEDAITREQVPRDYHGQIRDYFKSLNER